MTGLKKPSVVIPQEDKTTMNVHNLMEDVVIKAVNTLYDKVKAEKVAWLTCDCENCRLDTVSYVLNRIPPKYVVSGRGVTHNVEYLASSPPLCQNAKDPAHEFHGE